MVTDPVAFGVEDVEDCPQAAATSTATTRTVACGQALPDRHDEHLISPS
jgi:hypothetical protein